MVNESYLTTVEEKRQIVRAVLSYIHAWGYPQFRIIELAEAQELGYRLPPREAELPAFYLQEQQVAVVDFDKVTDIRDRTMCMELLLFHEFAHYLVQIHCQDLAPKLLVKLKAKLSELGVPATEIAEWHWRVNTVQAQPIWDIIECFTNAIAFAYMNAREALKINLVVSDWLSERNLSADEPAVIQAFYLQLYKPLQDYVHDEFNARMRAAANEAAGQDDESQPG